MEEKEPTAHTTTILKELSDIKRDLAVNTNETQNIKSRVGEMQMDVKEIKSDFLSRREFNEIFTGHQKIHEDMQKQIDSIATKLWYVVGTVLAGIIGLVLKTIFGKLQ